MPRDAVRPCVPPRLIHGRCDLRLLRSPPPAISASARHAVGTDATGPNSSRWSPITRKSLIIPGPSAIAHARSEKTRPRSWPPSGDGSAADSPDFRPVPSASRKPLPPRPGPARRYMPESALLTGRGLRTIARVPARLSDVTLQTVVFTLPFLYVFGSAIHVPGMRYQDYLIPGMIAQTVAFGVIGSGVATATDFRAGVIDRFTSLPVTRLAVITAQLAGQTIEQLIGMIIVAALGLALGWRPHLSPASGAALAAIIVLGLLAFTTVGILLGMTLGSADAVQGIGFAIVFPLAFLGGTFVPSPA